jgi:carbon-monoxide dehydrogenase small subunit
MRIKVTVNGETHQSEVEPRLLLVHYIRDHLRLTGTHIGCDTSNCGACTVFFDGEAVKSCTILAVQADGHAIGTIEAVGTLDDLHPVQDAFWEHHALQCGFCTPGMIIAAIELLRRKPNPTIDDIKQGLEGNLCRCTGYINIIKAVEAAGKTMSGGPGEKAAARDRLAR